MSRHEGVSCDSCLKKNFRGRRYKCLVCYDYDLCSSCYEAGATTTHHTTGHPMQCILTRSDFELYYGGESLSVEQPQSFTCPHCGRMGLTETTLQEHVTLDHTDTTAEVVCPVCASLPGGDPNLMTDDLAGHLNLEHRNGPRDLISFLDEPASLRHGGVRRGPHASRGVGGPRPRRCNMHLNSGGLSSISPSTRDTVDPIAELLSQLSGVRRSTANNSAQSSTPSQLQQLQIQLQLERQQVRAARQQLDRLPRRQAQTSTSNAASSTTAAPAATSAAAVSAGSSSSNGDLSASSPTAPVNLQFLLSRCTEPPLTEIELQAAEQERADHSLFVQEIVMSTLSHSTASVLSLTQNTVAPNRNSENSEAYSSSRESPSGGAGARVPASPSSPSPAPSSACSSSTSSSQQRTASGAVASKRMRGAGAVTSSGSSSRSQPHQIAQPQQQQAVHLRDGVARGAVMSLQAPPPQPMRVVTGTGTIREVVGAPSYSNPGSSRRKPVRTATEPPPPH